MFHPVGSQPPAVYWRRRFAVLATLILVLVLLALTVRAITSNAAGKPGATGSGQAGPDQRHHTQPPGSSQHAAVRTTTESTPAARRHHRHRHHHPAAPPGSAGSSTASTSAASTTAASTTAPPPPPQCVPTQLDIQAAVGQTTYHVGEKPVVMLQVTNTGKSPCVQDLADQQIVLKIYNGESRVWGSHDCQTQPGTDNRVLSVDRAVRVSITWSGLTSQPGCTGTRHRVGAGTYTLYAYLAGHQGRATQFSMV